MMNNIQEKIYHFNNESYNKNREKSFCNDDMAPTPDFNTT